MTELALRRVRRRRPPRPGRWVLSLCYVALALCWIGLLSVRIAAGHWWETIGLMVWLCVYVANRRLARGWQHLERDAEELGCPIRPPARWEWSLCGAQFLFLLGDVIFIG